MGRKKKKKRNDKKFEGEERNTNELNCLFRIETGQGWAIGKDPEDSRDKHGQAQKQDNDASEAEILGDSGENHRTSLTEKSRGISILSFIIITLLLMQTLLFDFPHLQSIWNLSLSLSLSL